MGLGEFREMVAMFQGWVSCDSVTVANSLNLLKIVELYFIIYEFCSMQILP